MDEFNSEREKLYNEVWKEPVTTVSKRYGISDTGLRKRCKALNIPLPSVGYWAKLKAGKSVEEKPELPPYIPAAPFAQDEVLYGNPGGQKYKLYPLELISFEDFTIDELRSFSPLEIMKQDYRIAFTDWCNSICVPMRANSYHKLIISHMEEIEYRQKRDKEYPLGESQRFSSLFSNKIAYRDNKLTLSINVSLTEIKRAYRLINTLLLAFEAMNAAISVDDDRFERRRIQEDNVCITFLDSKIYMICIESKSKRRYMLLPDEHRPFKPLYEEIYDGKLILKFSINKWDFRSYGYYENKIVETDNISFIDSSDKSLEDRIGEIVYSLVVACCKNKLDNTIEEKLYYEKQAYDDLLEKTRKDEEIRKARKIAHQQKLNDLINDAKSIAKEWFLYKTLDDFILELEAYVYQCQDKTEIEYLSKYIEILKQNVNSKKPVERIIQQMKELKEFED